MFGKEYKRYNIELNREIDGLRKANNDKLEYINELTDTIKQLEETISKLEYDLGESKAFESMLKVECDMAWDAFELCHNNIKTLDEEYVIAKRGRDGRWQGRVRLTGVGEVVDVD